MKANQNRNHKIFKLNHGTIQVFNFLPNYSRMALFRLQEMKKIDADEQIIVKEDPPTWFSSKEGIIYECGNYVLRMNPPKTFEEKEDNYEVVKRYIEGIYRNASVHIKQRDDIGGESIIFLNPKHGMTRKKVHITPNLYLEYLLENERFTEETLQTGDLTKEKPLFRISEEPIMECSMESLQDLLQSGLVKGDFEEKQELLEASTKVYEKLKK